MQNCQCRQSKKKWSTKRIFRLIIFAFLILIILLFIYYLKVVCPIVVNLSEEKIRSIATSTISDVVGQVLDEQKVTYNDLAKVTYSDSQTVEMIEINTLETNKLIRIITKRVQDNFDTMGKKIEVSLGTFSGIPFLYGVGPGVQIQLISVGTINTKINSSFISAGINQTLHRLDFVVNAGMGMILPAKTQNFNTQLEILLCENLIIGKVPNVYLQGKVI